ncbi:MAG: DUF6067 family protein, partial [Candidatus Omnitrophica bacterium]|nr:DUF6067 family protein [Candidatus Omnitrophota bacterium]
FSLPSKRQLVAQVFLPSQRLAGKDVVADIKVVPEGKSEPLITEKIDGFDEVMKEAVIDISGIPVGPYKVEISVKKGDMLLGGSSNRWFKSGDPKWLNNDIGIIKEVPSPWTPVEHKRDTVTLKVWGREYSFKNSLLPSSLKVLGDEILSGPVRLILETESGKLDTSVADTPQISVEKPGIKAKLKGSMRSKEIVLEVEGEVEFDGFGYFTFTFKPEGSPVEVKSIVLELPIKKQYAQLYDDANYNMFNTKSGSIPAEGISLPVARSIRIGDTSRGIQLHPVLSTMGKTTTKAPLIFTPSGDTMVLRYVISEGIKIDKPVENRLGFICTPVKPFDAKRMRKTGHAGPPVKDLELIEKGYASAQYWTAGWTGYAGGEQSGDGYYHFTESWCEGLAKLWKEKWETERIYPCLYVVPGMMTSHTPEYATFWKEWNGQYIEGLEDLMIDLANYDGAEKRPRGRWMDVDFTVKSYQDFYFYCLDRVLSAFEKEGVRVGIYVDCTPSSSEEIIKPYRQWVQRLHQIVRKHSPDGLIVIHMSGDRTMAVWGIVDSLVEGEQYTANWRAYMVSNPGLTMNDCYPKVLPMDRVRASYAGTLWGPLEVFLSQFWTDKSQKEDIYRQENKGKQPASYIKRFRYITGLMLLHDVPFWGEFYACGVKGDPQSPWIKRAKWGYDETVQFIPYWDTKGMIKLEKTGKEEILASGWMKPDGNLMVILFNNTDTPATVKLKINTEKFPVKLKEFTALEDITSPVEVFNPDATEPDIYKYNNGSATIDVRPRDFRLMIFR